MSNMDEEIIRRVANGLAKVVTKQRLAGANDSEIAAGVGLLLGQLAGEAADIENIADFARGHMRVMAT